MDYFKMAYTAAGGLGVFFLGMTFLSESLQAIAGDFIKKLIGTVTSNRLVAVIVGLFITTIIQSSSVTTVMVVGMVNAGLMNLMQAIGVILGANIGTTITGWILAIKVGKYGLLFIGLGIFPMLFSKNERRSSMGKTFVALGLIFFGLELMSNAFKPLRSSEDFLSYMQLFDASTLLSVLGCVVIGCFMTLIIQSSSAMLGVTIALAVTGSIPFETAAALVLGENIGTTITAQLASIGAGRNAKRAALCHAAFNVVGVLIMILLFHHYIQFIDYLIPGDPNQIGDDGNRPHVTTHIATVHSIFNVTATIIMLPFIQYLAKLSIWVFPETEEEEVGRLKYIGKPGYVTPAVALNMARMELGNLKNIVDDILTHTRFYTTKTGNEQSKFKKVEQLEDVTDNIQAEIATFISHSIEGVLTHEQSDLAYSIVRAADELESIADYALSLCAYRRRLDRYNQELSEQEWQALSSYFDDILEFYQKMTLIFDDTKPEESVRDLTAKLNTSADKVRHDHLKRMSSGKSSALPALTFSDMIVGLRRIKNHSLNLYEALAKESIASEG